MLEPNARLGPYQIVAPLGTGGMGEVYRARDTRLGRDVAIKVLATGRHASDELRQRFEREARIISRLVHPNICAIFDVGREGDIEFLVMELLEGETLAARIARGRLSLDQALRHGAEIAAALAAAHAQGVVHRDLKPANVMLTAAGVKLLDFGLARVLAPATAESTTATTSVSAALTEAGTLLGTVPYMAPEQVEGRAADARADIFALGAVLYEMITGRRAFAGDSQAAVISAILTHDPPSVSSQVAHAPAAVDRLVRRCLAKDPTTRWSSAADLALHLRELADPPSGASESIIPATPRRYLAWLPWAAAAIAVAFGAYALMRPGRPADPGGHAVRFSIAPPESGAFYYETESPFLAVSPDGSRLAYLATDARGVRQVWQRRLDAMEASPVPGTEDAISLFWSPDGRALGFFTGNRMSRVELAGGPAAPICDLASSAGYTATWGRGEILFCSMFRNGIYRVPDTGGTPSLVVAADTSRGDWRAVWPWFLPDGRHFVYLTVRFDGTGSLWMAGPGMRPRALGPMMSAMAYAGPGYLVYVQEGTLFGRRFDLRSGRLEGGAFPIAEPVRYFLSNGGAAFAASAGGTLAYQSTDDVQRLTWFDRGGKPLGTLGSPGNYNDVSISADGRRVLASRTEPRIRTFDVWAIDVARDLETRITSNRNSDFGAVLIPGRERMVYSFPEGAMPSLHRFDLGTGRIERLLKPTGFQVALDVSPDGRTVLYVESSEGQPWRVWSIPVEGGVAPAAVTPAGISVNDAHFSPDGRYLAVLTNESGRPEVYVMPFRGPGERVRVSSGGAAALRWSRSGEILYIGEDRRMMSVPVRTSPTLQVGSPAPLFTLPGEAMWPGFDVSADGRRILGIVPQVVADRLPLSVVVDWPRALGR